MSKLLSRIVGLVVLFALAHFALRMLASERFIRHWQGCHDTLHLATRLPATSGDEREQLIEEFRLCVVGQSNVIDLLFFGRKNIDAAVDALR